MATLPDLVHDSRLAVEFLSDYVSHKVFESGTTTGKHFRRRQIEERWQIQKRIGRGGFGDVRLEKCISERHNRNKLRAVKVVRKKSVSSESIDYTQELEAMAKFSQAKYTGLFVQLYGWFEDIESIYIAMEYFELGDLQRHLTSPLPEKDGQQISHQLLEALEHIHANGFVHRDLKPANIFVVQKTPEWLVKLGDFGVSQRSRNGSTTFQTFAGTLEFLAPEVARREIDTTSNRAVSKYTCKVDMWSLGVIIYYMLVGSLPWKPEALPTFLRKGRFPQPDARAHGVSEEGHDFILSLVNTDPADRLSANYALQHGWLESLLNSSFSQPRRQPSDDSSARLDGTPGRTNHTTEYLEPSKEWTTPGFSNEWSHSVGNETLVPKVRDPDILTPTNSHWFTSREYPTLLDSALRSGIPLHAHNQDQQTERNLGQANENKEKKPQGAEPDYPKHLVDLGVSHYHAERYEEAEKIFRKCYKRFQKTLGSSHHDTVESLCCLGVSLLEQETKYMEAEEVFQQAHKEFRASLGPSHFDTLMALYHVKLSTFRQKKYQKAEKTFRQSYESLQQTRGSSDPETLDCLYYLGLSLFRQATKYKEAEEVFKQVHDEFETSLGPSHSTTLGCLHLIGISLAKQEKYYGAIQRFTLVYHGRSKTLGPNHCDTVDSLDWLAYTQGLWEQFDEAEKAYKLVHTLKLQTLGPEHGETRAARSAISDIRKARRINRLVRGIEKVKDLLSLD